MATCLDTSFVARAQRIQKTAKTLQRTATGLAFRKLMGAERGAWDAVMVAGNGRCVQARALLRHAANNLKAARQMLQRPENRR